MAAVVLAAGIIKGAIGFGFPSLATPFSPLHTPDSFEALGILSAEGLFASRTVRGILR